MFHPQKQIYVLLTFAVVTAMSATMSWAQQHTAFVAQYGNGNRAETVQVGTANDAVTLQRGEENQAAIAQDGANNVAGLLQVGDGFEGRIEQTGRRQSETRFQIETTGGHVDIGSQTAGGALFTATVGFEFK